MAYSSLWSAAGSRPVGSSFVFHRFHFHIISVTLRATNLEHQQTTTANSPKQLTHEYVSIKINKKFHFAVSNWRLTVNGPFKVNDAHALTANSVCVGEIPNVPSVMRTAHNIFADWKLSAEPNETCCGHIYLISRNLLGNIFCLSCVWWTFSINYAIRLYFFLCSDNSGL